MGDRGGYVYNEYVEALNNIVDFVILPSEMLHDGEVGEGRFLPHVGLIPLLI